MEKFLNMPLETDMRNVPHRPMRIRVKQMQTALNVRVIILIGCFFLFSACSSLKNDQEQAEAFFQSGMTKMASNHLKSAIIEFKNAIHKNPKLAKAHFQLGLAYVSSHQVLSGFIQRRPSLVPRFSSFSPKYFAASFGRQVVVSISSADSGMTPLQPPSTWMPGFPPD